MAAADRLLPMVYGELKNIAAALMSHERSDHTLQATALVHEAYLRLVSVPTPQCFENRGHFLAAAAESMRRILVESARSKKSLKRGGSRQRVDLVEFVESGEDVSEVLLDPDDGLSQLAEQDAESAALVESRLFAGLSVTEAGAALGMSRTTAHENWEFARSWFAAYLRTSP